MGQSKQLRSPYPGRIRKSCFPTLQKSLPPFHGFSSPETEYQIHQKRVIKPLDASEFKKIDKQLLQAIQDKNDNAIKKLAFKWGLKTIQNTVPHEMPKAEIALTDRWLAAVAEDFIPDIGVFGPDMCFGNMAHEAMAHLQLRITMGAVILFTPGLKNNMTAAGRFMLQNPKPNQQKKAALLKWLRTPTTIWKIHNNNHATPMIDIGEKPTAPIANLPNSKWMVARIVETNHGPIASMTMPLPEIDIHPIQASLYRAWIMAQRHSTKGDWLDLLRYRPDCVYNLICRWAINNGQDEELIKCWHSCYSPADLRVN